MYVCLCNSFTCSDVRRVRGEGASTPAEVYRRIGCRPQCGKCRDSIRDLLAAAAAAPREEAETAV